MNRTYSRQGRKLSVVVPVYNEIGIIEEFHNELVSSLLELMQPFEIIYVDDYSNDGTYEWLATQASKLELYKNCLNYLGEIIILKKRGKRGKAYSLVEGFAKGTGAIFVMIDGDLQYPPSAIRGMVKRLDKADIIVADRQYGQVSFVRSAMSLSFRYFFGKVLFSLNCDIQSGLKVFKREVFEKVKFIPSSAWTFDLEFLQAARFAGFSIENHKVIFAPRSMGISKVNLILSTIEIGWNAARVKLKRALPFTIPPHLINSMRGAGIGYKNQKYITHTNLTYMESAFQTFTGSQIVVIIGLAALLGMAFIIAPLIGARVIVTIFSILYFADTIFNLCLVLRSIRLQEEATFGDQALKEIKDDVLPIYTILCPLYKEVNVAPQFIEAIAQLDWPKDKLDVIIILEEDDRGTIESINKIPLPYYFRTIIIPHSMPKTKPKACNYGLSFAKGKFLVIYDAEDIPDPLQLKKAYHGFKTLPLNVRCMQAKLNYYNPGQNLLTRFFTAEYSLWFDLTLTGLQSLNSAIPLGGTSNHFRTNDLIYLQGWDPFNVTEDADLGVRLFKNGYKTAIIDSTTLEEANSDVRNWVRQRSRWIKGYLQTYLVHMRDFRSFVRANGLKHALIFQLTIGGKLLFLIVNPFMWVITLLYFVFYTQASYIIELVYYPPVTYIAIFSWLFGNFLFLYYYMIACGNRNQWSLVKYVYLMPFYWAMMSYAGGIALYQLLFRPHYWEKTIHGLHLGRKSEVAAFSAGRKIPIFTRPTIPEFSGAADIETRVSNEVLVYSI